MRIALVIERMRPERGGRERSVAQIAVELAARGHDVTILCQEGELDSPGVETLDLGRAGATRAQQLAGFVRAVAGAIQRERYDIVHATLAVPGANVYQPRGGTVPGLRAARERMAACPVCRLWGRLTFPLNRARMLAWTHERRLAADAKVTCVAVSRMLADEFAAYYGRRENVAVVYNGVTVPKLDEAQRSAWRRQWRSRWNAPETAPVFLCVAHNFALKGVPETVAAFAAFLSGRKQGDPAAQAHLVIVGGDRPGRDLRAAADRLSGRVTFEPAVEDVFPLYSAAEAVVLLSWQDACSRTVLEALRWGVPSLTTRYNGAHEILGEAGVVIDSPRDTGAAAAGLADLADPVSRQKMVAACREKADFAGMKRQVDELVRVYEQTLEK